MMQRALHFFQKEQIIWGVSSLLVTVALSAKSAIPIDLLMIGVIGLFLSSRLYFKGFVYSMILLSLLAAFRHSFIVTDHLFQLGLEGSFALAFFIIALDKEQTENIAKSVQLQIDTKESMITHLEDELIKNKDESQHHQIAFQEKIFSLQKELEELQSEHSSILILNDVLRKTTARHIKESESSLHDLFESKRENRLLKEEMLGIEEELARVKNSDELVIENKKLKTELNGARVQKEQTELTNEALNRLALREKYKAQEAEEEASHLTSLCKEQEKSFQGLQDKLLSLEYELESLKGENELIKTELFPQDPSILEELDKTKEKLKQIEPLYKQLQSQFEEKTAVLHQVRSELFKTETELKKHEIDSKLLQENPVPREVAHELYQLGEQIIRLEEENQMLQELISQLNDLSSDSKRKKKVKIQNPPEQEFLF